MAANYHSESLAADGTGGEEVPRRINACELPLLFLTKPEKWEMPLLPSSLSQWSQICSTMFPYSVQISVFNTFIPQGLRLLYFSIFLYPRSHSASLLDYLSLSLLVTIDKQTKICIETL